MPLWDGVKVQLFAPGTGFPPLYHWQFPVGDALSTAPVWETTGTGFASTAREWLTRESQPPDPEITSG